MVYRYNTGQPAFRKHAWCVASRIFQGRAWGVEGVQVWTFTMGRREQIIFKTILIFGDNIWNHHDILHKPNGCHVLGINLLLNSGVILLVRGHCDWFAVFKSAVLIRLARQPVQWHLMPTPCGTLNSHRVVALACLSRQSKVKFSVECKNIAPFTDLHAYVTAHTRV